MTDVAQLRSEYNLRNPDSPYRENVSRGEVVCGMDMFGVLASWGLPQGRKQDGVDGERWVYIDVDEVTNRQIGYAVVFRSGLVKSWNTYREKSAVQNLYSQTDTAPPPPPPNSGKPIPTE
jgi:hypothetical protein